MPSTSLTLEKSRNPRSKRKTSSRKIQNESSIPTPEFRKLTVQAEQVLALPAGTTPLWF
jgi:hypothetical protein